MVFVGNVKPVWMKYKVAKPDRVQKQRPDAPEGVKKEKKL
jgi:hypothetical protein